jgi:hypothetical protein
MASRKYAYYIKGSKIAIIEESNITSTGYLAIPHCTDSSYNNRTDCEAAGETWIPGSYGSADSSGRYISPTAAITDGLEIEYAYSPTYVVPHRRVDATTASRNFFAHVGWTVVDGYLTFLPPGNNNYGSSNYALLATNSHILIEGSSRWNGIHKIQEAEAALGATADGATHGGIKTYTKVSESVIYFNDTSVSYSADKTISNIHSLFPDNLWVTTPNDSTTAGGSDTEMASYPTSLQSTPLWICGSDADLGNVGLFTNWKMTSNSVLDLSSSIWWTTYGSYSTLDIIQADPVLASDTTQDLNVYQAFLDPGFITANVDVLSDESDTIDLPEYLAKALVYYVKAKIAEDQMDIEQKEYYMREFRILLEKHESSKVWGGRYVMSGPNAIR